MSSNLKVNTILPSTGTSIGIGTAGGAVLLGATTTSNAEQFRIHTPDSGKAIIKLTNSTTGTGAGDGFEFGLNANEQIEFVNKENTDMFFATNNTERLRITSNGSVGIGTNNPAKAIQVGSASSISQFQIHPHAAGWDIGVTSGDIAPHFQSKFILYNGQLGAGSERFRVSAEGFVTKIKHPSFRATRESSTVDITSTAIQTWDTVSGANRSFDRYTDGGYGFNTSTHKYKVPVTGVWYFHASVYTNAGQRCMFDIRTSSQILQRAEANETTDMPNNNIVHASVVTICNKDDEVYVNQSGGQCQLIAGSGYISFDGHFIG